MAKGRGDLEDWTGDAGAAFNKGVDGLECKLGKDDEDLDEGVNVLIIWGEDAGEALDEGVEGLGLWCDDAGVVLSDNGVI